MLDPRDGRDEMLVRTNPGVAWATEPPEFDVCVVGAGLSGLACARRLVGSGVSIIVFEARDRVGGRTLNAAIGHGEVAEMGGQWVGPEHGRLIALAAELGVSTFPTYLDGDSLFLLRGRVSRFRGSAPRTAPLAFADFLQAKVRLERMARRLAVDAPWQKAEYVRWDTLTPAAWIAQHMRTKTGRDIMRMFIEAILAVDPADISLLHLVLYIRAAGCSLDALVATADGAQQDRFVGGSQEIALRMGAELDGHVHLNAPVRSIEHSDRRVSVRTASGLAVRARFVVVAIPPVLLASVQFEPPLSGERMQQAQRMLPGTVIKYIAVYERPFWREQGLSGMALAVEGPVKVVFDNSPPGGEPGALLGFVLGREARSLARQAPDRRRELVLGRFGELFGVPALHPERFLEQDWAAEPWTRGCYAGYMGPGGGSAFDGRLRDPVGSIHWAGSETATGWAGSMDGAVRAGERAAEEIVTRLAQEAAESSRAPSGLQ